MEKVRPSENRGSFRLGERMERFNPRTSFAVYGSEGQR
jgi:hypothetical protein